MARTHTSLELEARGNPSQSHAPECDCMECAIRFLLLPQDIDLVLQDHHPDCDCLDCLDLDDPIAITIALWNHPYDCNCAECTCIYMLQPQNVIDMEENKPRFVHKSPRSRTSVDDSDSHTKIKNSSPIDFENVVVPGQQSPYSPPRSPDTIYYKSYHIEFPEFIYGVDTPLSPHKSPY